MELPWEALYLGGLLIYCVISAIKHLRRRRNRLAPYSFTFDGEKVFLKTKKLPNSSMGTLKNLLDEDRVPGLGSSSAGSVEEHLLREGMDTLTVSGKTRPVQKRGTDAIPDLYEETEDGDDVVLLRERLVAYVVKDNEILQKKKQFREALKSYLAFLPASEAPEDAEDEDPT